MKSRDGLDTSTRWNLIAMGLIHIFYLILLVPLSILSYCRTPKLFLVDWYLFYYYKIFYPSAKHHFEMAKSGRPASELTWGLTPYYTLDKVLRCIPIRKNTVFYDLGCGPGGVTLYVAKRYGIRSVGLDVIETYVRVAIWVAKKFKIRRARFGLKDYLEANLDYADILYIAGTCLSDDTWELLEAKLNQLRKGVW